MQVQMVLSSTKRRVIGLSYVEVPCLWTQKRTLSGGWMGPRARAFFRRGSFSTWVWELFMDRGSGRRRLSP